MTTIALLGTGLLGSGMVTNLLAKGNKVRIWNRSANKLAPLVAAGAVAGKDPADTVRGCTHVHLVLAEDPAVDAVTAALRPGLAANVPVIDHSTNLPHKVKTRFETLRRQGVRYVPAPVFMSPTNAREASGLMVMSGPRPDHDELNAHLSTMTGKVWYAGDRPELAAVFKLAGNSLYFAFTAAIADVLQIGKGNDVSPELMLTLLDNWKVGGALPFIGQRLLKAGSGPVGFELVMARKDARLMQEAAGTAPLVVLPGVAAAMDAAIARGKGSADFAAFVQN